MYYTVCPFLLLMAPDTCCLAVWCSVYVTVNQRGEVCFFDFAVTWSQSVSGRYVNDDLIVTTCWNFPVGWLLCVTVHVSLTWTHVNIHTYVTQKSICMYTWFPKPHHTVTVRAQRLATVFCHKPWPEKLVLYQLWMANLLYGYALMLNSSPKAKVHRR